VNCVRNHPPLTPPVKGGGWENPLPWREREGRGGISNHLIRRKFTMQFTVVSKIDLPNSSRPLEFLYYYHAGNDKNRSETPPDVGRVLFIAH
jgi:hypothetical protein